MLLQCSSPFGDSHTHLLNLRQATSGQQWATVGNSGQQFIQGPFQKQKLKMKLNEAK